MATKAENVHADMEKKGVAPKKARKLSQRKPKVHHEPVRAGKKASYALEDVAPGKRPSRKSTRVSSNRAKPDSNLERRSERADRSPERRAAKSTRSAGRVRGKRAGGKKDSTTKMTRSSSRGTRG